MLVSNLDNAKKWILFCLVLGLSFILLSLSSSPKDSTLKGRVLAAKAPLSNSMVTLWSASSGKPKQVAQTNTDKEGNFILPIPNEQRITLYIIAQGGHSTTDKMKENNPAKVLMTVIGEKPPANIIINEMTTIASVWTHTQFLDDVAMQGHELGLRIAASNVNNLANIITGSYGEAIQDALNSGQTPTMANFGTLANLLAGAITEINKDALDLFLTAATTRNGKKPNNTLLALQNIVRDSGYKPDRLFALLDLFYPIPKGKNLRPTPFMPYLSWAPSAWVFPLKFSGGGLSGPGKIMIDSKGNIWAGDNFIVGFQNQDSLWAGNLSKFAPNGKPLSPMTTGFTGGGVEGIGFGLAIDSDDNVWGTTYGSKTIVKFNNEGKPLSPSKGYNFNNQLGLMQGVIVTPSKDLWALDIEHSQVVYLPKGNPDQGKILFKNKDENSSKDLKQLMFPFALAIDQQDRIWITNTGSDYVTRFHSSNPEKFETFKVGYSPASLAVDSQGNVWVANRFGNSEKGRNSLLAIAEAAKAGKSADALLTRTLQKQKAGPEGGSVTVLRPDGSPFSFSPIYGNGLVAPWGVAVDGNDHIWISNFASAEAGIVQLAGCRPETNPEGYVGGGMQAQVDIAIDPAGNVWVGNNWQNIEASLERVAEPLSTLAAGQGLVVFYGMAKPVKTPLIGPVQQPTP